MATPHIAVANTGCPYCERQFAQPPSRRRKCPACGNTVFVKSTPKDRTKRLMTEADAAIAERQWADYQLRQESLRTLQPFGLTEASLEREIALGLTERDALRVLLERVTAQDSHLHLRKIAFSSLAFCADKEGQPYAEFLRQAARCELLRLKQSRVRRVEILTAGPGKACSQCQAQANTVLDIDVALNLMPLPCPACTRTLFSETPGFCRCSYVPDAIHLGV